MKKLALVALALVLGLAAPGRRRLRRQQDPARRHRHGRRCSRSPRSSSISTSIRPRRGRPAWPAARSRAPGRPPTTATPPRSSTTWSTQQVVLNGAGQAQDLGDRRRTCRPQLQQIAAQYGGTQKMYAAAQKAGMDHGQLKTYVKNSLLGQKLYEKVIGSVHADRPPRCRPTTRPTSRSSTSPPPRTVRHILVKTKAQAAKVRALLAANDTAANWAKVAKKYSIDPGTKNRAAASGPSSAARWWRPSTRRPSRCQGQHDLGAGQEPVRLAHPRGDGDQPPPRRPPTPAPRPASRARSTSADPAEGLDRPGWPRPPRRPPSATQPGFNPDHADLAVAVEPAAPARRPRRS